MAQDGIECRLTTNFRSDGAILDVVNGAFETLIQAQAGLQPPYIAIEPAPGRASISGSLAKLSVRKIIAPEDQTDAETARRIEGESLARWLKELVLGKAQILNARGETVHAQPKDVAILMRKLTDIHDYLEPFRRQGIRYVVEGERHFYAAKEIIDAVNLLRAVENPYDRLALVGVLRSPLGGLTDLQIYQLHRQNRLDYRDSAKLDEQRISGNAGAALSDADTAQRRNQNAAHRRRRRSHIFNSAGGAARRLSFPRRAGGGQFGQAAPASRTTRPRGINHAQSSDPPARTARARRQGRRRKRARRRKSRRRAHHEHPQGQRLGISHRHPRRLPDRHRRTPQRRSRVDLRLVDRTHRHCASARPPISPAFTSPRRIACATPKNKNGCSTSP